jgi:hypothetical protein
MADVINCDHKEADGTACPRNSLTRSMFNNGNGNFCAEHFAADNQARAAAAGDSNAPA